MSDFKKFRALLQDHFNEMVKSENPLFVTDADEDELYNLYLDSFPAGTNELFRKRREFDCSCCRRFVKNIGKLIDADEINNGSLCETLESFLNHNCNVKETAQSLIIHRNTLNKIRELLGVDFENLDTCLELKLAFMIRSYRGRK